MAGDKESTLVFKVDGTQAETGVAKVKRSLNDLADTASREGQRGAAGIAGMGAGAEKSAAQIERSTQRQIAEIRRMTAELESGGKATRAYQEAMASIRGVDPAALRPYLDQLDAAKRKQLEAAEGTSKLGDGFMNLRGSVLTAAAALASYVTIDAARSIIEQADAISLLNSRLKLSTSDAREFASAQKELFQLAQSNGIGLSETITLYTKLADPIKRMGGGMQEVIGVTNAFQKALQLGGVSAQEAASATLQFGQALGSGVLAGDEFKSLAEASPRFMKAIADGMDVPIGKLKQMASDGELTAAAVSQALLKVGADLEGEFANMPDTFGKAMTRMQNEVTAAIGKMNEDTHLTLGVAGLVDEFSKVVPVVYDELGGAVQSVGEWLQENRDWIVDSITATKNLIATVWDLVKGAASVYGAILEWTGGTNIVKIALESVGIVIAGIRDGVRFLGGAFATLGSLILQTVLAPVQAVLKGLSAAAGMVGKAEWAASINGAADAMGNFAKSGARYGDSVVTAFQNGDSAVQRFAARVRDSGTETKTAGIAAAGAAGGFKRLKDSLDGAGDSAKKSGKQAKEAKDEFAELFNKLTAKDVGLDPKFYEQLNILFKGYQQGRINVDEYRKAVEALVNQQKFAKDLAKADEENRKRLIASIDEERAARMKLAEEAAKRVDSIGKENDRMREEIETLGLSAAQIAARTIELNNATIAEKENQLARLQNDDISTREMAALEEEIKLLKERNELIGSKAAKQGAIDAAKQVEDEWKKTADSINQSLTDALLRGFEGGKDFAKNFRDTLINMFKTLVLRPVISFIVQPIGNAISGMVNGFLGGGRGGGQGGMGGAASGLNNLGTVGGLAANWLGVGSGAAAGTVAAANAVGAVGGDALGALIVGNGGWGTIAGVGGAAGGAGGVLSAIPGWGWALGGLLALFGGKLFGRKLKDYGIEGEFGGEAGFEGRNYRFYKGGLFRSDKTRYSELEEQYRTALARPFIAARDLIKGYASTLGLDANELDDYRSKFKLSLKGKKDNEINEAIAQAIATASNEMAQQIIGSWQVVTDGTNSKLGRRVYVESEYAREGEKAIDTLTRLATSLKQVNSAFDTMGHTLLTASLASGDLASRLIDAAGGQEAFGNQTQSYWQNYYTEEERAATIRRQIAEQLGNAGVAMPDTRAAWRAMVEETQTRLAAGDESAIALFATLMRLSDAFASVTPSLDEVARAAADTADRLAEEARRLAEEARRLAEENYNNARSRTDDVWSRLQELFNDQIDNWRTLADEARGIFETAGDARRALRGEMANTRATDAASATNFILDAARAAMSTGALPDQARLAQSIEAARAGLSMDSYASLAEFEYDKGVLAAALGSIESVAGVQLTEAERQVQLLEEQRGYWETQLAEMRKAGEIISTIEQGVSLMADALRKEQEAADAAKNLAGKPSTGAGGGGGGGGVGGPSGFVPGNATGERTVHRDRKDAEDALRNITSSGGHGRAFYNPMLGGWEVSRLDLGHAANAGVAALAGKLGGYTTLSKFYAAMVGQSVSDLAAAMGYLPDDVAASMAREGYRVYNGRIVPAYARGGYHPGGLAWVGEEGPELVDFRGPARIYSAADSARMSAGDDRALRQEVRDLKETLARLLTEIQENTREGARVLSKATSGGNAMRVEAI